MQQVSVNELVFETEGYEVVCLVENDNTDLEQEAKDYGESSPSNSFKTSSTSLSFYSMKQEDDLDDEPFEGYEVESEPAKKHHFAEVNKGYFRSEQSDNSLVVYNQKPPLSPMSQTKYSQ